MMTLKSKDGKPHFISANISYYLTLCGITPSELAERVQLTRQTLSKKLEDPDRFAVAELRRISRVFGVPISALTEERNVK